MSAVLESRVRQLEQELSLLRRELAAGNQRTAAPQLPQRGWFLAVLTGSLAWNGTASADTVYWNGTAWKKYGITLTIQGFWLNTDEAAVPAPTLIRADYYDNVWVPTAIYCKVNNWTW